MLRLAVSNVAWAPGEASAAYALLADRGLRGLEVAPGLLFHEADDPFAPSARDLEGALAPVRAAGLELVSLQALLFGVEGAELFGDGEGRRRFVQGVHRAIALAGRLGVPNLVMGSPRQRRIPPDMDRGAAERLAREVFEELGDAASAAGTRLGMEPNPQAYGTNFLTDLAQAAAFVERLGHPSVMLTLDTGALKMTGELEGIEDHASRLAGRISHVHLSEPDLAPAPASLTEAARVLAALSGAAYDGWVSVEMRAPPQGGLDPLSRALGQLTRAASPSKQRSTI